MIFLKIEKIGNTKNAEKLLGDSLIRRIDHVAFGCYCEYPDLFVVAVNKLYEAFRVRFDFKKLPRKMSNV